MIAKKPDSPQQKPAAIRRLLTDYPMYGQKARPKTHRARNSEILLGHWSTTEPRRTSPSLPYIRNSEDLCAYDFVFCFRLNLI